MVWEGVCGHGSWEARGCAGDLVGVLPQDRRLPVRQQTEDRGPNSEGADRVVAGDFGGHPELELHPIVNIDGPKSVCSDLHPQAPVLTNTGILHPPPSERLTRFRKYVQGKGSFLDLQEHALFVKQGKPGPNIEATISVCSGVQPHILVFPNTGVLHIRDIKIEEMYSGQRKFSGSTKKQCYFRQTS